MYGMAKLLAKAASFHEYVGASSCATQPLAKVGILGPWWNMTTMPSQAYPRFVPSCGNSDIGTCIYGAGCGAQRVLFTVGSNITRHTDPGWPLWNASVDT
jgi:hypothetical protein